MGSQWLRGDFSFKRFGKSYLRYRFVWPYCHRIPIYFVFMISYQRTGLCCTCVRKGCPISDSKTEEKKKFDIRGGSWDALILDGWFIYPTRVSYKTTEEVIAWWDVVEADIIETEDTDIMIPLGTTGTSTKPISRGYNGQRRRHQWTC